jgi:hypothetical protein
MSRSARRGHRISPDSASERTLSRAHGNKRYVKLALAGLVAGLLPSVAQAELVTDQAESAVLAIGAHGTPTVAYLGERGLVATTRAASGWRPTRVGLPVPATEAAIVSAVVGRDGRPAVLVEDVVRRTLVVAWRRRSRWLVVRTARLPAGVQLGVGGLALEPRGTPVVAYAFRQASGKTFLRLVQIDARGRAATTAITKLGFPESAVPPSAVPHVTRSGRVRVVEAYTSALIDWFPDRGKWTGQYLFASRLGSPLGRILAIPGPSSAVVAWTQDYPEFGESHVMVQQGRPTGAAADLLPHARLSALTLAAGRPEVGANDWVDVDGWTTFAGMLAFLDAPPVELDARVEGYAAVGATRELLLKTDRGLEWFSTPRPAIRVSLAVDAATGEATGRVDGVAGGDVQIYRDAADTGRQLVATAAIAPDGSFAAKVPALPTLYRAVYRDPVSGIPYGALLRSPLG